jgi:ATP-dependent exoDNAse (exonuclease V) beta subunit
MPQLKHELIRASAGTGKTYQLTNRYLQLLRMRQRPDQILAATFTRKAAGEILNRILLRVAQAADDRARLVELRQALDDPSLTREQCREMLAGTTSMLHRLRVGTLDSFFAQLAGAFALELGLPPGWRIVEEHQDTALRDRAIEAVLDKEGTESLLTLMHALTQGEPMRSLEGEVRKQVRQLYSVYRESSRDEWFRVPRPALLSAEQLAAALDRLRTVALPGHKNWEKSRAQELAAARAGDWPGFLKGGIAQKVLNGEATYYNKPIEPPVVAAYRRLIEQARAVLLNQLANQTEATYRLLDKFHQQYQRLKAEGGAVRFEDITLRLAEWNPNARPGRNQRRREAPSLERLSFRLDSRLRHLLLDEFQDTSLAQWSVLQPFAEQVTLTPADHSFFCVGDTKQAIYGWRGGVVEIFDAVARQLPGIQQRPLDVSWRSSPVITDTVQRIFRNLHRHSNLDRLAPAVQRWQRQFTAYGTAGPKQGLNGYVRLQAARVATEEETDPQELITLRFAARQVADWKQKARAFTIGVLTRENETVRRMIYELRELGVEASEEGGSSLDDSAAVRLILSLLRLADHPADSVARFHLATSPLAGAWGWWQATVPETSPEAPPEQQMTAAIRFAGRHGDVPAGRLARRIRRRLIDHGYGPTIYQWARQLAPFCDARELRRLEKLIGLAYPYEATSRTRDFLAYVEATKVRDPISADVRVMTVHQAKGLEFDIVVLVDLGAQLLGQADTLAVGRSSPTGPIDRICRYQSRDLQPLLPAAWQRLFQDADDQKLSESLCRLYVATTRPVHALHMIMDPSADNERKLQKNFGGLLRAALTDGGPLKPEQIAFEAGDPGWYLRPGVEVSPSASEVAARAEALPPLQVTLAAPAKRRSRGLQRVSPSGLEGGTRVRLARDDGHGAAERAEALARGTVIHAWFERVTWIEDGEVTDRQLLAAAAALPELGLRGDQLDRLLREFRQMLAWPAVADCLSRDSYPQWAARRLDVEAERPIAVRQDDRLLVGSIDRLVTAYEGPRPVAADIIDFKTDALPAGDEHALQQKVDHYRPQLEAYRQAVSSLLHISPAHVQARLLFVQGPAVVALREA